LEEVWTGLATEGRGVDELLAVKVDGSDVGGDDHDEEEGGTAADDELLLAVVLELGLADLGGRVLGVQGYRCVQVLLAGGWWLKLGRQG